ncbi:MAG: glycosyltransferase family 4 protein [Coriobacteriia bacterium]|nr:glycosyltransferase family 4 protein [Coriobacteriia bacterium]
MGVSDDSGRSRHAGGGPTPSALFVTTVPITLEAFLVPFAGRFRSRGWRVDALANGATRDERIADAFDERFDVAWSRDPLAPSNLLGTTREVRRIVTENRYDIVHVHTPVAAFVTRYALRRVHRRPGGPVVIYTAHGFHFYRGQPALQHAAFRALERVAAPWTDYLVTINAEDHEAALALGGIAPERVRNIPGIGVDTQRFRPDAASPGETGALRAELGVAPDALMLAMVAEMAPVKRHAFALEALARADDPRVIAVFVGEGPLQREIREQAERLGLAERTRFLGYRRDVPRILAAADAFMLVSEREGLPRSLLEAMACGTLAIGTDTRGIADAIGDAGWVVDKHDPADLASAIVRAAEDREAVRRAGEAARERACAEFSLERVLAAYEELYREALS